MTNGSTDYAAAFASLGQKVAQATDQVNVIKGSRTLDPKMLYELSLKKDALSEEGRALLTKLEEAEEAIRTIPLARYNWIEEELAQLAEQIYLDPEVAFRVIGYARAKVMPDGTTEMRPFLVDFRSFKDAEAYANEHFGKRVRPLAIPVISRDNGRLETNGVMFCVPHGLAELQAFEHIRRILKVTEDSVISILQNHDLFDLRLAAEWIVKCFARAQLVSLSKSKNPKVFKAAGEHKLEQAFGKPVVFLTFKFGREELLLLPETPQNASVIERLVQLKRTSNRLRDTHGLNIEASIVRALRSDTMPNISAQDFLKGEVGRTAVRVDNWKHRNGSVDVLILLEREGDGMWRALLYNQGAKEAVLTGGRDELRFTWFSNEEIPPHLAAVLNRGRQIRSPEDVGLTEADVADEQPADDGETQKQATA